MPAEQEWSSCRTVVTVPELLDGHTVLDIECLDRVYLNGYVPTLRPRRGRSPRTSVVPTPDCY